MFDEHILRDGCTRNCLLRLVPMEEVVLEGSFEAADQLSFFDQLDHQDGGDGGDKEDEPGSQEWDGILLQIGIWKPIGWTSG
jgi:hypothetical protein